MIKRISLVRLRADLPRETCVQLWSGAHADIVRAFPGVLEYTIDVASDPREGQAWDAVATLRFADDGALNRFLTDPGVQRRLIETRDEFAEAVDAFIVKEHVLIRA